MDFDEYQESALRTAKVADRRSLLTECALGLAGESGEVADHIKKHHHQGHDLIIDHLKAELGDVLWYVATMARALGLDLSEVASANVAKLKARYPDGFDPKRSRDRGDGLLGDDRAVEAAKAVVVDREVVEVDGVRWVRMSGQRVGGVWQATWLAIDDERVKLHRMGEMWTLKRGDVSYGVFDSSGIATVYAARKALRWAAVRLNTPGWDNDFKDSLPKQPVEPRKPPTVTIPSERLELEERWAEHVKGAGRVVVKGGT